MKLCPLFESIHDSREHDAFARPYNKAIADVQAKLPREAIEAAIGFTSQAVEMMRYDMHYYRSTPERFEQERAIIAAIEQHIEQMRSLVPKD